LTPNSSAYFDTRAFVLFEVKISSMFFSFKRLKNSRASGLGVF